jgi:putative ATPase
MGELFGEPSGKRHKGEEEFAPLADRMRPRELSEFVGQEHLVGPGRLLRRLAEQKTVTSLILWGPPGSGKTTLARLLCESSDANFLSFSAVLSGVDDLRAALKNADRIRQSQNKKTVLFVDEIHRWNKAQQDAFLPYVEHGKIILIGATTENPSFEVISPLLSRCRVAVLKKLETPQIKIILENAIKDSERGLFMKKEPLEVEPEVLDYLSRLCEGDARRALNALELADDLARAEKSKKISISFAEEALTSRSLLYDKTGEEHYNLISAFIKSMRGSDPDAALYWMVRMIESGEDPRFICRRMIIFAAEDVGLADPSALQMATACEYALEVAGLPEAIIPMAETCVFLASSLKSNSAYMALSRAKEEVAKSGSLGVPMHLRNPVTALMGKLGYGKDYKYPHDFPGHFIPEQYLPDELKGRVFFEPGDAGKEIEIKKRIEELRKLKKAAGEKKSGKKQ